MIIDVMGQIVDVMVGELIELHIPFVEKGSMLKNVEWIIPGEIVAGYENTQTKAKVKNLRDKNKKIVKFYWVDGGDGRIVEAKCVYENQDDTTYTQTVSATFNVKRPTCDFISTTGKVAVDNPGFPDSGLELHFGNSTTSGITWIAEVTTPSIGGGKIKDVQVLITTTTEITELENITQVITSDGQWVLDNTNPYSQIVPVAANTTETLRGEDTPGNPLYDDIKESSVSDLFQIWIMYKSDKDGAIWVPLSRITWEWRGKAVKDSHGSWTLALHSHHADASGTETTEFPEYLNNFINLSWQSN